MESGPPEQFPRAERGSFDADIEDPAHAGNRLVAQVCITDGVGSYRTAFLAFVIAAGTPIGVI